MLKVSRPAEALNFNAVSSSQPSSFGLPIAYPERIVRLRGKSNVTVGWPNPYLPEFQNIRSMDQQNHQKPGLATIQQSSQRAPSYHVPQFSVVSVEHPFIIRNVGKAIEMLGGLPRVNSLVQDDKRDAREARAQLYLRPNDPMCKPVIAKNVVTNDLVLKVTIPKRTGLKRKRGTCGPFQESPQSPAGLPSTLEPEPAASVSRDTRYMLRGLRDNAQKYQIKPVGSIFQTHRFRGIPDFVYSTANSPFMKKMTESVLSFDYEKLKNFKFDMSKGPRLNTDLIPPPRWSHVTVPFNYLYLQNPGAKPTIDPLGNVTLKNDQVAPTAQNQAVLCDTHSIPSGPAEDLPAIASLEPAMQRLINQAQLLLEERPIWTRRALRNRLSEADWNIIGSNAARYIYQYVGYLWASGPWRDAIVKFGIDPRDDQRYRIYQTMMFIIEPVPRRPIESGAESSGFNTTKPRSRESHLFDGKSITLDGKVWQVCDITDPQLMSILSTSSLRHECHVFGDGWFHNGTWAKAKMIMKSKLRSILAGVIPSDVDYTRLVSLVPDAIDDSNRHLAYYAKKSVPAWEIQLLSHIRNAAKKSQLDEMTRTVPVDSEREREYGVDAERGNGNRYSETDEENDEDEEGDDYEGQVDGEVDFEDDGEDEDEDENQDDNDDDDDDEDDDDDDDDDGDGDGDFDRDTDPVAEMGSYEESAPVVVSTIVDSRVSEAMEELEKAGLESGRKA